MLSVVVPNMEWSPDFSLARMSSLTEQIAAMHSYRKIVNRF